MEKRQTKIKPNTFAVECPRDYIIDEQMKCTPCTRGWYNDAPGSASCKKCSVDDTSEVSPNCQGIK